MTKKRPIITILVISFFLLAVIMAGCFLMYVSDYYHSDEYAEEVITDIAQVQEIDSMWVFYPEATTDRNVGLIFYPGGKVEASAYAPLLSSLTEQGITSVLIEMPFNLAVFDNNAAEEVYPQFPEIDTWYIGGHSLGGAMASSYADGASKKLAGIILLGAYSVGEESIPTLAIYGSQDQVLDKTKLNSSQPQFMIEGGNHANFGNYGNQKGDGVASISREEQQQKTVDSILDFIAQTSK
jgi:hypothetical protein